MAPADTKQSSVLTVLSTNGSKGDATPRHENMAPPTQTPGSHGGPQVE